MTDDVINQIEEEQDAKIQKELVERDSIAYGLEEQSESNGLNDLKDIIHAPEDENMVSDDSEENDISPPSELLHIEEILNRQGESMTRMSSEIREMHKLYHNEFAGRLKSMQDELERYHEIDRGRVFDDILREVARIYCDNEALLSADADEKVKKHIRYLFMDIEQLLESNGVMIQRSMPGDKRNNKFCQIVDRVETDDPDKHDTVVKSKGTGFYTEKRPLIKELIDVYIYRASEDAAQSSDTERS